MPDGRIIETRHNPVEGGGSVRTYTDVTASRSAANALKKQKELFVKKLFTGHWGGTMVLKGRL